MTRSFTIFAAIAVMPFLLGQGCPVTTGDFNIEYSKIENNPHNGNPPDEYCGDNACSNGESCGTCPQDCGACPTEHQICGDGACNNGESCTSCPQDCGACPPQEESCGDGTCNNGESCTSCQQDCGVCPKQPPIAIAGSDQSIYGGESVMLDGRASHDPQNAALSFSWKQTGGPNVVLNDPKVPTPSFLTPYVTADILLTFRLTVTNGSSSVDDSVDVIVRADPPPSASMTRFLDLTRKAKVDRVSDHALGTIETSRNGPFEETNTAGNRIQEFTKVAYERTSSLSKLLMMDNTIGKVYPGSLLWAAAVRDGQLHQLPAIPKRPSVTVGFTGTSAGQPVVFSYDGSYSGFQSKAAGVFSTGVNGGTRVEADFKISSSIKDALLSIGISASYWGARMQTGLESMNQENRSVAVLTFDQVAYSASVDVPPPGGFLPKYLLARDAALASTLADGAVMGGEPVYVRKVDYGRRILVALSSEASVEELTRAMKTSVSYVGGKVGVSIDNETKKVWESVEGKLIIIGGSYPDGVSPFFGGDLDAFKNAIQAIMSKEYVNKTDGAVPVSFELAYAADDAPMQVFETVEFAGRIPGRRWGLQEFHVDQTVLTTADNAAVIREDAEVHSDDWTLVTVQNQSLSVSPDKHQVLMKLTWLVFEAESNRTVGNRHTIIRSERTIPYTFPKEIREIVSPTEIGPLDQWYAGRINTPQQFPDHGYLRNVQVTFDGPTDKDQAIQRLAAEVAFTIWLEE